MSKETESAGTGSTREPTSIEFKNRMESPILPVLVFAGSSMLEPTFEINFFDLTRFLERVVTYSIFNQMKRF